MKVNKEVAENDVAAWLEYKNIPMSKRESKEVEALVSAVENGSISIDPDSFVITHELSFPIENEEGEATITSLQYVPRIKVKDLHRKLKGVKGEDIHGMVLAYAAALTKQPKQVIENLDLSDYNISQTISVFFM